MALIDLDWQVQTVGLLRGIEVENQALKHSLSGHGTVRPMQIWRKPTSRWRKVSKEQTRLLRGRLTNLAGRTIGVFNSHTGCRLCFAGYSLASGGFCPQTSASAL